MRFVTLLASLLLLACSNPVDPIDGRSRSEPSAYVRGDHPGLVIELDVMEGVDGPRDGVETTVIGALDPLLDKPAGIRVVSDDLIDGSRAQTEWTFDDLVALGDEAFDEVGTDDEAVMHTLWLPGRYISESGATVLGVAWSNRHIAMFAETIDDSCSATLPLVRDRVCREAEAAVWTHEVGHVIGLVNNGIPLVTPHEDGEHPRHTSDEDGVMYFAYERASAIDLLAARMAGGDERLFEFGPGSLADVAAFRDEP